MSNNFRQKEYKDYKEYVKHQMSKFNLLKGDLEGIETLAKVDIVYRQCLEISNLPFIHSGVSVLCLGARGGGEVRAFVDAGCFAIGIDLASASRKFVLHGDFHDIQFADKSLDVVFTNSLDHANPIEKVVNEIYRVLVPNGHLIVETISDENDNHLDKWASCWWNSYKDLIELFESNGFSLTQHIDRPKEFFRNQICFKKNV